jgi:hypothetical protein
MFGLRTGLSLANVTLTSTKHINIVPAVSQLESLIVVALNESGLNPQTR